MSGASCVYGGRGRGRGQGLYRDCRSRWRENDVGAGGRMGAHLRQDLQLHHLAAPPEHFFVIVEVAQDVLPVLGVQLQRVVRCLGGGHAQHLDLVPRHDELVRGAEEPGGGDEARALGVDVQRAQQVDAVAAGHDVAAVPAVRALGLGPGRRHRGRGHGVADTHSDSTKRKVQHLPRSRTAVSSLRREPEPGPASPFVRSRSRPKVWGVAAWIRAAVGAPRQGGKRRLYYSTS